MVGYWKGVTFTSDLARLSIAEVSRLLRNRKVSPVELTQACLERIARYDATLNAFITVTTDSALAEARVAEVEIDQGCWKGPLHGIPVAIKDLVDTAGIRTTAGSELFKDRIPEEDAEVIRQLKAAGAVVLGKTNLHEFAYGGSSVVSHFGPVRNPWNLGWSSGGSSGGSAVAVAAGLCYAAIGTDTGGSIRQPASYCGVVGLKPTYGRVSTRGVIPLAWSLDHVGPLTRSAADAAIVLQAIVGYDANDPRSLNEPAPDFVATIGAATKPLRLAVPRDFFWDNLDSEIASVLAAALAVMKELTLSQRDLPALATDATYTSWTNPYGKVFTAEAYACHQSEMERSPQLYQAATLKRLRLGAKVSAAEYVLARREMERVRRSIRDVFDNIDLLIIPTVRILPFPIEELQGDSDEARKKELEMLHNTRPLNFTGLPTITLPCGFAPIGLQITGRTGDEVTELRLARAFEQATDWHKREPPLETSAAPAG